MHRLTDHPQRGFEVAIGRFEGVGVDGERCAEHHERCAILRTLNGLLCLTGTFVTLLAYAKIFGEIKPEQLALIVILMMAGSILTLLTACAIKAWVSHQTEAVMIGNYSGGSCPSATRPNSVVSPLRRSPESGRSFLKLK